MPDKFDLSKIPHEEALEDELRNKFTSIFTTFELLANSKILSPQLANLAKLALKDLDYIESNKLQFKIKVDLSKIRQILEDIAQEKIPQEQILDAAFKDFYKVSPPKVSFQKE